MTIRDRTLDNGLTSMVSETDTVFLCATDPASYAAAAASHVGQKTGSRGSMFFAISSPVGGGRQASLASFSDGTVTSNGSANFIAIGDSVLGNLFLTEALAAPQAVQSGGAFSITAMQLILGASTQPIASSLTVGSPVIPAPLFFKAPTTAVDFTVSSPAISSPILVSNQTGWTNVPAPNEIGMFAAEWDATPLVAATDAVMGLSNGPAGAYTDMATSVIFTTGNVIQARNGGAYAALSVVPYSPNQTYHIRLSGNINAHVYDVWITPPSLAEVQIASSYAFRTEQAGVTQLNNWARNITDSGGINIANLVFNALNAVALTVSRPVFPTPLLNNTIGLPQASDLTVSSPVLPSPALAQVGGYNNLTNFPSVANRPSVTGTTLSWIGPAGGGPSQANDVQQSLVLTSSGALTLSVPNTVTSGLDIAGVVNIVANNITLRRSRISSNATATIDIATGVTGTVIEDCYIDSLGTQTFTNGGFGIRAPAGTFRRNQLVRSGNSFAILTGVGPTLIVDNWAHNMLSGGNPHYDQVQIDGGVSNVTISHNALFNEQGSTSVIMIDNWAGAVDNIVVDNNRLIGGGITCYVDGSFSPFAPITNVSYTNNRLGIGAVPGYTFFAIYPPTFTGNVDDVTSAAIPASALPLLTGNFNVNLPAPNGTFVGTMTMQNLPAPAFCRTFLTDGNGVAIADSALFIVANSDTGVVNVNTNSLTAGTYHPAIQAWGPNGFTMTLATISVGVSSVKSFTANNLIDSSPAIDKIVVNNKVGVLATAMTVGRPSLGLPTFSVTGTGAGYDNLANWPSTANRPQFSAGVLSWTGPVGGGPSTSNDTPQTLTLTNNTTGVASSANGQVISGLNLTGGATIVVNHNNVTIRNCRILYSGQGIAISHHANTTGMIIEDCLIDGQKVSYEGICPVIGSGSLVGPTQNVIRRNTLTGFENHITMWPATNVLIIDNYFTACGNSASATFDGDMIEFYAGSNMTAQHNQFDGNNSQTSNRAFNSMVNLTGVSANLSTIAITNNLFSNCSTINAFVICDDNGQGGTVSCSFVNNGFFSLSGKAYRRDNVPTTANSGNFTAATITATSGALVNGNGAI